MNTYLNRLAALHQQQSRLIIGLMSGTSLDGLDIGLCRISGSGEHTKVELLHFETLDYTNEYRDDIRSVFSRKLVDLEKLTLLNAKTGAMHGDMVNSFLKKHSVSNTRIGAIASHGQTIYHAPKSFHKLADYPNATLQIGDADHIAVRTGIITLSDFRQKHIAAGGEGAPLALYGDYILFSSADENRVLLNIGGISNFTFLPRKGTQPAIVCSDAGPGNTLIDLICKTRLNTNYDLNGDIARSGKRDSKLLSRMLSHPFLEEEIPKTTGPELFNSGFIEQALADAGIDNIPTKDLLNTLTHFTAEAVALTLERIGQKDLSIYVSGGGASNTYLMDVLAEKLPLSRVNNLEKLGVNADAKEAILFAILANETICGSALQTSAGPAVMMGKISLP